MAGGIVLILVSLIMDFAATKTSFPRRHAGHQNCRLFYRALSLPVTKKNHRKIIYFIFLFPLLFTFRVTVIIPLVLWYRIFLY